MKSLILSLAVISALTCTSSATSAQILEGVSAQETANTSTKVAIADLPEPVRNLLGSEDYSEWTAVSAELIKSETEYYSIQLKKGEETKTIKVDASGKVL